jgi:site-specific DNA-methyltransferase (adenine-specific)
MSIEHINCLDGMKKIPDNSIDMVCTDPPYFLDGLGNDWDKNKLDKRGSSSTVTNLPKGMKFDRNQSKKFKEFYNLISKEVFRILKPGGAFISFSSPRLYHALASSVEDQGFEIRDMLGWVYTQSQVKAFKQDHIIKNDKTRTDEQKKELIEKCSNWRTPMLKPSIEPMCLAVKPIEGRYIDNFEKYGTGLLNCSDETLVDGKFPSNIMTTQEGVLDTTVFMVKKPNKKEKGETNTHLSVKPVDLIQHLIQLFTREGATVLDPFIGSGTTAIACVRSNRQYLGFEINEEYVKISKKRLKDDRLE